MLDKRTDVCYYKHVNKIGKENKMRHIYVKTPNGLGKLNFYDGSLWLSHYIVDHYKHDPKFYSGYYEGRYITNASCYSKRDIKYLRKRPLIDLITKRKENANAKHICIRPLRKSRETDMV